MALFDIVLPTDTIVVEDAFTQERILADTIATADSVTAQIIDTLEIAEARALTATKVRIDFSAPAKTPASNPALSDPASYIFTALTPGAVDVIPQSVDLPPGQAEPLYVEVNVTEHTNEGNYQVEISPDIAGANDEVGGGPAKNYVGLGASPILQLVLATSPTEVIVYFDETILDNASARDVTNYFWDNGLSTVAVKDVSGSQVTLQTTEQLPGELYNLTVRGILALSITDAITISDQVSINQVSVTADDTVSLTDQVTAEIINIPAGALTEDGAPLTEDGAFVVETP